jgi:hypothetical protein
MKFGNETRFECILNVSRSNENPVSIRLHLRSALRRVAAGTGQPNPPATGFVVIDGARQTLPGRVLFTPDITRAVGSS